MNIAKILRDKPQGTKLYSPAFGGLTLKGIHEYDNMIEVKEIGIGTEELSFYCDGRFTIHGESVLFPSKQMRDWEKFMWEPGHFLLGNDKKTLVMFCDWDNDDYTKFTGGRFPTSCEDKGMGPKTTYNTCDYEFIDLGKYELGSFVNLTTGAFYFKVVPKEPK